MNGFKKVAAIVVAVGLMTSMSSIAFATEVDNSNSTTNNTSLTEIQVGQKIGDFVVVDVNDFTMTTDEVVEYYINEKQYSLEAAQKEAFELLANNQAIRTIAIQVNATDDLGLTSIIEIGCRVRTSSAGGRTDFQEILDSWTGIISSGIQEWNEFTHSAEIVGSQNVSIDFYARGTIEVVITKATTSGFSFELLESLGYSVETSSSKDWHVRKVVDLEGKYTLPGY